MADSREGGRGSYGSRSESIFNDDRNRSNYNRDREGRGFFQRARDEVSSWFSDDDDWGPPNSSYRDQDRHRQDTDRFGSRDDRYGAQARSGGGAGGFGTTGGAGTDYGMRARGYENDRSRNWDRDSDRHPQTIANEPSGSRYGGRQEQQDLGEGEYFSRGQSVRGSGGADSGRFERDRLQRSRPSQFGGEQSRQFGRDREDDRRRDPSSGYGAGQDFEDRGRFQQHGGQQGSRSASAGWHPDDHYRSWRERQMQELDRDYEDYCREREQQFHQDFSSWRQNRQRPGSSQQPSRSTGGGDPGSEDVLSLGTTQAVGEAGQAGGSTAGTGQTGSGSGAAESEAQGSRQSGGSSGRSGRSAS